MAHHVVIVAWRLLRRRIFRLLFIFYLPAIAKGIRNRTNFAPFSLDDRQDCIRVLEAVTLFFPAFDDKAKLPPHVGNQRLKACLDLQTESV